MAPIAFLMLLCLAMAGPSEATYCLCNSGASESAMQTAIDYACGSGADCKPILQNGACYNPNTVLSHCSYAVNSYFQAKSSSGGTCNFGGVATLSSSAPSGTTSTCVYLSSPGTSMSPTTGSPSSTTTPTGTTTTIPGTTTTTPTGALSPSGGGFGDTSAATYLLRTNPAWFPCLVGVGTWFSGLVLLWRG